MAGFAGTVEEAYGFEGATLDLGRGVHTTATTVATRSDPFARRTLASPTTTAPAAKRNRVTVR